MSIHALKTTVEIMEEAARASGRFAENKNRAGPRVKSD